CARRLHDLGLEGFRKIERGPHGSIGSKSGRGCHRSKTRSQCKSHANFSDVIVPAGISTVYRIAPREQILVEACRGMWVALVGIHTPEAPGCGVEVSGAVVIQTQRGVELFAGEEV